MIGLGLGRSTGKLATYQHLQLREPLGAVRQGSFAGQFEFQQNALGINKVREAYPTDTKRRRRSLDSLSGFGESAPRRKKLSMAITSVERAVKPLVREPIWWFRRASQKVRSSSFAPDIF